MFFYQHNEFVFLVHWLTDSPTVAIPSETEMGSCGSGRGGQPETPEMANPPVETPVMPTAPKTDRNGHGHGIAEIATPPEITEQSTN